MEKWMRAREILLSFLAVRGRMAGRGLRVVEEVTEVPHHQGQRGGRGDGIVSRSAASGYEARVSKNSPLRRASPSTYIHH